jgi:hypothetical protein
MRFFNASGPCAADSHYLLPVAARLDYNKAIRRVRQSEYCLLYGPPQTGKTTALLDLARRLTASGQYVAALLSLQAGGGLPDEIERVEHAILADWRATAQQQLPAHLQPPAWGGAVTGTRINSALRAWAKVAPRPLVILLDELDALQDRVLISVLSQLRAAFAHRPRNFPQAMFFLSTRALRDYQVAPGLAHPVTFFNIVAESWALRNFSLPDVAALYRQHTDASGQAFSEEAMQRAYELTAGQPQLVNALAKIAVEELAADRSLTITSATIDSARERLLEQRGRRLDWLMQWLREPRVRQVLALQRAGKAPCEMVGEDLTLTMALGLLQAPRSGGLFVANPIYAEIVRRELAAVN